MTANTIFEKCDTYPMIVGGNIVPDERTLLSKVENGTMMNSPESVRFIVIHCSATNHDYPVESLRRDHLAQGFMTIGYHFYIRKDGTVTQHRKLLEVGAHARGYNRCSIGICYEGGLDRNGEPHDTRTPAQKRELRDLISILRRLFPWAKVVGHRDLPGVHKACPCFSCREYN